MWSLTEVGVDPVAVGLDLDLVLASGRGGEVLEAVGDFVGGEGEGIAAEWVLRWEL